MMKPSTRYQADGLAWRCHMPNLLNEILQNPGTSALHMPLRILGHTLHELAELAIDINDPRLHLMAFDLTLYETADPQQNPDEEDRRSTRAELVRRCEEELSPLEAGRKALAELEGHIHDRYDGTSSGPELLADLEPLRRALGVEA